MIYTIPAIVEQRKGAVQRLLRRRYMGTRERAVADAICDRLGERPYDLFEAGYCYERIWAGSLDRALAQAEARFDPGNYPPDSIAETCWIDVGAVDAICGDHYTTTMTLEPEAPACDDGLAHSWGSPYSVLGGLRENPGVWGHGGGVVIKEVCAHCGAYRVRDTWAQRPDTGEQGLQSLCYRAPDERSLAWVRSLRVTVAA